MVVVLVVQFLGYVVQVQVIEGVVFGQVDVGQVFEQLVGFDVFVVGYGQFVDCWVFFDGYYQDCVLVVQLYVFEEVGFVQGVDCFVDFVVGDCFVVFYWQVGEYCV